MKVAYLIGSLRNPEIPAIGERLREVGLEVFDDWFAGGKIADDEWKQYELDRGHTYLEALQGFAAKHVFDFDHYHLDRSYMGILICPSGKSGHLELGYMLGQGKPGFVMLDNEDMRWDVMYKFADGVFMNVDDLIDELIRRGDAVHNTGETESLSVLGQSKR